MKMISFYKWLTVLESQNVEIQVAKFLENIISRAAQIKKDDLENGQLKQTLNYIKQVWPSQSFKGNRFIFPPGLPQDIVGKTVHFYLKPSGNRADTLHDNGQFLGFNIDITGFNNAKNADELDDYVNMIKSVIHHEVEHIYNVGDTYDPEDYDTDDDRIKGTFRYMSNLGELKAHARQMAYLYAQKFPGQKFDLEKAKTILNDPAFNQTHRNYFDRLSQPTVWHKYSEKFPNMQNPFDAIMRYVPSFVDQYNKLDTIA